MHHRRLLALALAVACLLLSACGRIGGAPRYFAYLDAPAAASLSGKLGDVAFTATLNSAGRSAAEGASLPLSCDFSMTYLSPPALAGVKVSYAAATGKITVTLGDLCAEGEAFAALAAPALLLLTESPVQASAKQQDGSLAFTTTDGVRRVLSADGLPLSLSRTADGRRLEVDVVWG